MPVKWKKRLISEDTYEAAGVFDVNNDGIPDIVSGEWWYEGPDYSSKHRIGDVQPVDDPGQGSSAGDLIKVVGLIYSVD